MSGARGRERRYEPSEPDAVMMVSRKSAGTGSSTEPTRMFYVVSVYKYVGKLTSTTAPGTLHACFQHPTNVRTPMVCHHPTAFVAI